MVRGRKSAGAMTLTVVTGDVEVVRRPEPPSELTREQAAEWRAVVDRLPADWFTRETHGLLVQYCRHVVAARRVAELVASLERETDFDLRAYDHALKMQEREGRALSSLATRMRITQQATVRAEQARRPGAVKKPWE